MSQRAAKTSLQQWPHTFLAGRLSFTADVKTLGCDPAPLEGKPLELKYRLTGRTGVTQRITDEHERVELP